MGPLEIILVVSWLLFRILLVLAGVLLLCLFIIALIKSYIEMFQKEKLKNKIVGKMAEKAKKSPTGNPPDIFGVQNKTTQKKEDTH